MMVIGMKNGETRPGPFSLQNIVVVLDRPSPPMPDPIYTPTFVASSGATFKPGIIHCQLGSAHGIVDEGIHLFDFFFLDELGRIEIFHFARNLGVIVGRIEFRDSADAGLAGADGLPRFFDACPERSDQPQTGHHNASGGTITHHALGLRPFP